MTPLEVTEWLFRQPPPITRGLIVNMPARGMSVDARLFQARAWREYAMTWHGRKTRHGIDQRWCEQIGKWTYAECIRRARVNVYLARRCNRQSRPPSSTTMSTITKISGRPTPTCP
jgi:hypothetical protein